MARLQTTGSTPQREPIVVAGRLVLDERVATGRLSIANGLIEHVDLAEDAASNLPFVLPGFVDLHVHGWGGHDALGDATALDGMSRALLRRGVTSFLPTAATAPLADLRAFAERVRGWLPNAPADGAEPLGFNLEGPFLSVEKRGAHDQRFLLQPAGVDRAELAPLLPGLRLMTVAPEIEGGLELIGWLRQHGVAVSIGHSAAGFDAARAAYRAGAASTTHLFNAMSGVDHHSPGLAVAALTDDDVFVELIADGHHVDPALWPIIMRTKPADRVVLVSDGLSVAGTGTMDGMLGTLQVQIVGDRATVAATDRLAGSLIALDTAVRNLVRHGVPLSYAAAAASRNALAVLGIEDRGRLAEGQRADLVELDDKLEIQRVMRGGEWRFRR